MYICDMPTKTKDFYIKNVVNSNKPEEEYVVLRATEEKSISLSGYALIDLTFDDEGKSNIHRHVYLFPDVTIEAGDFVWVYTGKVDITSWKNTSKTQTHVLSMQSDECIWNDKEQDSAILWKFEEISRVKVPKR